MGIAGMEKETVSRMEADPTWMELLRCAEAFAGSSSFYRDGANSSMSCNLPLESDYIQLLPHGLSDAKKMVSKWHGAL